MQVQCPRCQRVLEFLSERPCFCAYCGQALADTPPPPTAECDAEAVTVPPREAGTAAGDSIPERVGGYRLLRPLGEGGMGAVYEAEDASGQRVAVKLISFAYDTSEQAVERFRQEGRLASTIAHPRCVFVLAADEEAGQPYIVMELMPGATLEDVVRERGPLTVEEAVAKILDVIDGLQEAHRRGVIHRDVKPSNCFAEADGRVKVGDFGLAKSLVSDARLTTTGTFVGTPLYASPEQIRKEPLDARTDVYSTAATLFCLLTGRAPFQSGDAILTMARIVADPPPSLRSLRPEIPAALDKIVLRGLERDRSRRWQNMDELREALLPFVPSQLSRAGAGLRFMAYLFDSLLLFLAGLIMGLAEPGLITRGWLPEGVSPTIMELGAGALLSLLYYTLLEGISGCSLGKRLLRLRVCPIDRYGPPGLKKACWRWLFFYILNNLPCFVGLPIMASTMRERNGYRGLHEFLSRTRTIRLPFARKRRLRPRDTLGEDLEQAADLPAQVGSFKILGLLRWTSAGTILLGEDSALQRKVSIWLRPVGDFPLHPARRALTRATRLRWLASGGLGEKHWDAFVAPLGCPLRAVVEKEGKLLWPDVRPILEELTDELVAACKDGSLPRVLTPDQVWIDPAGKVQLLDFPIQVTSTPDAWPAEGAGQPANAPQQALAFLRQVATLALEGRARSAGQLPTPIAAPVPQHAIRMLHRLLGVPLKPLKKQSWLTGTASMFDLPIKIGHEPYGKPEEFQADLVATRDAPVEVSRVHRASQLLTEWGALCLLLALILGSWGWSELERVSLGWALLLTNFWAAAPVLTALVTRGRYANSWWMQSLFLRRTDGRRPRRLQAAFRAFLFWSPVSALLSLSVWVGFTFPELRWLSLGIWCLVIVLLLVYAALAIRSPNCSLHDRLAGTYLVPE
jgi:hypothetical protein